MPIIKNIQKENKEDVLLLIEILNEKDKLNYSLSDDWFDYIIKIAGQGIFVAIYKEKLVGLATCIVNQQYENYATINILVHPSYRKQGIGTKLYQTLTIHCKNKGIKTIEGYVKSRLVDSINFAKKRGFHPRQYAWELELNLVNWEKASKEKDFKGYSLREAKLTIADSIAYGNVINQVFNDPLDKDILKQILKDNSIQVLLLENEEEVIGTISIQYKKQLSMAYIYDVAILKTYRSMGLGTYMLNKSLEIIKEKNIKKTSISVMGDNKTLILYKKLGFMEKDIDVIMLKEKNKFTI